MLHMEEVWRVVCAEVMFHVGEQSRRCIASRLNDLTVQTCQSFLYERLLRVLITGVGRLFQNNVVALGFRRHQAQSAGNVSSLANVMALAGMSLANRALSSRRYLPIAS